MKKLVSLLLASCVGLSMATSVVKAEEAENYWCATEKYSLPVSMSSITYMENVDSLFGTSYPKYLLNQMKVPLRARLG